MISILKTLKFPFFVVFIFLFICNPTKALEVEKYLKGAVREDLSFRKPFNNDKILGPGDVIDIEILDLPEFSSEVTVDPMGKIYLPRIRGWMVEGLTYSQLNTELKKKLKAFIKDPIVYIRPVKHRDIRVFVGGEVTSTGFYVLKGLQNNLSLNSGNSGTSEGNLFPNIFDAIRSASGITNESDLREVTVVRSLPNKSKIYTKVDLLSSLEEVNSELNLRLFDGDVIIVSKKSDKDIDQVLKANLSNLNPPFIEITVVGRVREPGIYTLPRGSSLSEAIDIADGTKVLHGKLKFIRINSKGQIDKRLISFKNTSPIGSYENPILRSGDVIRIKNSTFSLGVEALNEITKPFTNLLSPVLIYNSLQN